MTLRKLPLVLSLACATASTWAFANTDVSSAPITAHKVDLQQIRNATVKITYGDNTFLVDPMLAKKEPTQDLKIPTVAISVIQWSISPNRQPKLSLV